MRHHSLTPDDLAAIHEARTPETRLGYALQLCALSYPGRHFRRGELLPVAMLHHIAEQVDVDADALADFARPTRSSLPRCGARIWPSRADVPND